MSDHADLIARIQQERASRALRFHFSWKRCFMWLSSVAIFSLISAGAIIISFGYSVDLAHGTISQTSALLLDGPLEGVPLKIALNGNVVATAFPAKVDGITPGTYTLTIERPGYATWSDFVDLSPNERIVLGNIFLLYTHPLLHEVTTVAPNDSRFTTGDASGIVVKNQDELWVKGNFVTRTSANLYHPQWVGSTTLTVQSGSKLLLVDSDPQTNDQIQTIATFPTNTAIPYFIDSNGRLVTYVVNGKVWQQELFESTSFFGFLY